MTGATATSLDSATRRLPADGRLAAARRDPVTWVIAAAAAVGLALRLWQLSRPGYLTGLTEYDDGPYFGSAALLVHGALPYRDFILVQPPGITLLMAPAALAGQVLGTAGGMAAGRILTTLASTAGIALAGLLVRHRGALAALIACGVLAVYPDSVAAAHTVLVEPWLVLFCLAGAVTVLDRDRIAASPRRLAWGGAAFGFAGAIESWAILPVLVLLTLCWHGTASLTPPSYHSKRSFHRAICPLWAHGSRDITGRRRPRWHAGGRGRGAGRRALGFAGGVAAGFAVPVLPFAGLAPRRFYDSLIVAQVGPRAGVRRVPLFDRVQEMAGLSYARFPLRGGGIRMPAHTAIVLAAAFLVLLAVVVPALAALGARIRPAPLDWFAAGTLALVVAIFLWPSQFHYHFCAFLAPFLALAVALPAGALGAAPWASHGARRPDGTAAGVGRGARRPDETAAAAARVGRGARGPDETAAVAARVGHGARWPVRTAAATAAVLLAGCTVSGFAAEDELRPDVSPATIAAAARRIPPGACVVTDEVSLVLLADRFTAAAPGCAPVLDGLGTDLALSGGLKPSTGAGRVPAVAAVWWRGFRHAGFVWLSTLNSRRIAWTPALRGYFRGHFTRMLTDARGDALYRRTAPSPGERNAANQRSGG